MSTKYTIQPKRADASDRYRSFSIKIYPIFKVPYEYWAISVRKAALESIKFISQKDLENCFWTLRLQYQTRHVKFAKYSGQLRLGQ